MSYVIEIGQYWWNAQGRQSVIAVQRTLGRYIDTFSFCSPMAIRNDNEAYRYAAYSPIYPKFKVTDTLRRNGFKDDFHGIAPTILIPSILSDSRAETLLKAGRAEYLKYFLNNLRTFDACWQSYKVATRNGRIFRYGATMWICSADWARTYTARSMFAPPTYIGNTTADKANFVNREKRRKLRRNAKKRWRTRNVSKNLNPSSSLSVSRTVQSKSTYWRVCRSIWRRERQCTIAYSPTSTTSKKTR